MDKILEFQVKRIHKFEGDGKLKAFADLIINEQLLVRGLRVVKGKNDLFVSMPQEKGKDGKWYAIFLPLNKQVLQEISNAVLSAYGETN